MDLTNILEGTVSGVLATLISALITYGFNKMFGHQKNTANTTRNTIEINSTPYFRNPFLTSLFLTSFLGILTFFSLVYSWTTFNYVYLSLATVVLAVITTSIYHNQCPNCNRIFCKKLINKETLKEEKRPYQYRDLTIYLYSDETEKDRKYTGKEKTKMETWRTEKEFYACKKCGHKWDEILEKNLDFKNRPKPNIVRTNIRPPNNFNI